MLAEFRLVRRWSTVEHHSKKNIVLPPNGVAGLCVVEGDCHHGGSDADRDYRNDQSRDKWIALDAL